jgi:transposase
LIRQHQRECLEPWLAKADLCSSIELRNFSIVLQRDYAAVANVLDLQWSNGPTEGHINRLKMIKRLMFGRAKFDLLRIRVLNPT